MKYATLKNIWKRVICESRNAPSKPIEIGTVRKMTVQRTLCHIAT
jgi:hypothetical protein